jgi:hypothetical protein
LPPWTERTLSRCILGALLLAATPGLVSAQGGSLFERLNLDRLQLTALGAAYGPVRVPRVLPTESYSLHADYGEITRHWRVVFSLSYWGSYYKDHVVQEFVDRFRGAVTDPSGDDTVRAGRVTLTDIAVEADMRYTPLRATVIRPYVGGGIGTHVINAESALFSDTFVERAFDSITVGFAVVAGVDVVPRRHLAVGVQGRYNLLSNLRFGTARLAGTYFFGSRPAAAP